MTQTFRHYPLGAMIPDSVHAVCCSLPTMDDVIGYEEKRPEVVAAVTRGYPRFVRHPLVRRAMALAAERLDLSDQAVFLLPSQEAAQDCVRWVDPTGKVHAENDCYAVSFADSEELRQRAHAYLQHTGLCLSSRQAEDYLVAAGALDSRQSEIMVVSQSETIVRAVLQRYLPGEQLYFANSGMNAFYAALRAVQEIQGARGRYRYLQLGWLYLDTQRILEKFLDHPATLNVQLDVFDEGALRAFFADHGEELAAVVTELPTNPLIQTPNVALLRELCERHGVIRIVDPTIAGIPSVDVLPHTDVLVTSLTKYASHEGDVMIGALALNPAGSRADELAAVLHPKIEPPYRRDLARLAAQIEAMPAVAAKQNENARRLVAWLESHPGVSRVWHPRESKSAANFAMIARRDDATGAVFTIELAGPLDRFYDRVRTVKGPSFGTTFTMMCPFMYLAHYDEVSDDAGRARLKALGLNPELVRISAGCEPFDEIQSTLASGLE